MKRVLRVFWLLLTICSLLALPILGPARYVAAATVFQPDYPGYAEVDGPLHLALTLSPAVGSPRDVLTLELVVTNHQTETAIPEVFVTIPTNLSYSEQRFPAGMTYNYQSNSFTWLPIVQPDGGQQRLTLALRAAVADVAHPAQKITALIRSPQQTQTINLDYWIGLPPTASINLNPPMVAVGQPVQLQAIANGPGPFVQSWDLGDGRIVTAHNPEVVYPIPGTYEVTGQIANPLGFTQARALVTVVPQPTAAFSVPDSAPVIQEPVQFVNESGGQPPLSYLWDFGDGATSQETHPVHQYSEPGSYVVNLAVQSEFGTAQKSFPVTVGWAPVADFTVTDSAVTGAPVVAQAFHDDSVTYVRWDMGDGNYYEGESSTHIYRQVGDYVVTMTAGNQFGEVQVAHWVHVTAGTFVAFLPTVSFSANSQSAAVAETAAEPLDVAPTPDLISAPTPEPVLVEEDVQNAGVVEETIAPVVVEETVVPVVVEETVAPVVVEETTALIQEQPPVEELIPATSDDPSSFIPVELPPQPPLSESATEAEALLWYINEARRIFGLLPVVYNYELSVAAQLHTGDMAGNPDIMHDGSDGSTPAERQQRYGYNGIYGGEAVAWGWESPVPVVEFWVNSPPHRALILNPNAREVGLGFTADGTAPNLWYWAAEFGIRLESEPEIQP